MTAPLLYIAGPYSSDPVDGTRRAIEAADHLWDAFDTPAIVPHLSHLHHLINPRPWEDWLRLDLVLVERCDAVWRLAGKSLGADMEVNHAIDRGIPVLRSDDEVADFLERWPA